MNLQGWQFERIQKAMLSGFDEPSLRMLVRTGLDVNLEHIVGGKNLSEIVFNLVTWAERNGQLWRLVDQAVFKNPGNKALQDLSAQAKIWRTLDQADLSSAKSRSADEVLGFDQHFQPIQTTYSAATPPGPPHPITRFVPRRNPSGMDYLMVLERELLDSKGVVIWGAGGNGKTTLAIQLANKLRRTLDGIIWISLETTDLFDLARLTNELCIQLGRDDALTLAMSSRVGLARTLIGKAKYAVFVDGFERCTDNINVLAFLKQLNALVVIVTRELIDDFPIVELKSMSESEAQALFDFLIEDFPDGSELPLQLSARLLQTSQGNPAVIRWLVGQLRITAPSHYEGVFHRLSDADTDLADRIFRRSFALLDQNSQRLLLALSLCKGGATWQAIEQIALFTSEYNLETSISDLIRLAFLDKSDIGERLSLQGLTLTLTELQLTKDVRRNSLLNGYVHYFARMVENASQMENREFKELESERDNILYMARLARELQRWDLILTVWETFSTFLYSNGYWDDYVEYEYVALDASRRTNDLRSEAMILSELGYIALERTEYDEAEELVAAAKHIFESLINDEWVNICLMYLAIAKFRKKDFDSAEQLCLQAIRIATNRDDFARIGVCRNYLGSVYQEQGRVDEARREYAESIEILSDSQNRRRLASVLRNLGSLEQKQGNWPTAHYYYDLAYEVATEMKQKDMIAGLHFKQAELSMARGDKEYALRHALLAENTFRDLRMSKDRELAQALIDSLTSQTSG